MWTDLMSDHERSRQLLFWSAWGLLWTQPSCVFQHIASRWCVHKCCVGHAVTGCQREWTCNAKAEFYVEMIIIDLRLISLTDNQDSEFIHPCRWVWGACSCFIHSEDSNNITGAFWTARTGTSKILDRVTVVPVHSVLFVDLHCWHGTV